MAQLAYVANYWNYCEAPWYDIVVKKKEKKKVYWHEWSWRNSSIQQL